MRIMHAQQGRLQKANINARALGASLFAPNAHGFNHSMLGNRVRTKISSATRKN
jgi:hypothetical protein